MDHLVGAPEQDDRAIREYVLAESPEGEVVRSAERIATHRIRGERLDIWDVRTRRQRWWVITNPTNMYLQRDLPSMDQAFTLHLGLRERLAARHPEPWGSAEERDRLAGAWRRWTQASEALDDADEAEAFQAVGMRCREALLSFVHDVSDPQMVPGGEILPKASDLVQWTQYIAGDVAPGKSGERIRSYLKDLARANWDLVNWLTHAKNAVRMDGVLAVEGTGHTLFAFGTAIVRKEKGIPDRCPGCGSYRIVRDSRQEFGPEHGHVSRCEACGWVSYAGPVEDVLNADQRLLRSAILGWQSHGVMPSAEQLAILRVQLDASALDPVDLIFLWLASSLTRPTPDDDEDDDLEPADLTGLFGAVAKLANCERSPTDDRTLMPAMGMVSMDAAGERSDFMRLLAKVSGTNHGLYLFAVADDDRGLETLLLADGEYRVRFLQSGVDQACSMAGRELMAVLMGG